MPRPGIEPGTQGLYSKADVVRNSINNILRDYELTTLGTQRTVFTFRDRVVLSLFLMSVSRDAFFSRPENAS